MANYTVDSMDYTVVTGPADDIEDFNGQVITHLNMGWVCVGGVSTAIADAGAVLFQAMTKTTQMKASNFAELHGHTYGNDHGYESDGGRRKTRRNRGRRN